MKKIKDLYIKMYNDNRGMLFVLVGFVAVGVLSAIMMFLSLKPSGSVVKVLYSDLAGYRDGSWREMIFFPINNLVLCVLTLMMIGRMYKERGAIMTKTVLCVAMSVMLVSIVIFLRLSGEK